MRFQSIAAAACLAVATNAANSNAVFGYSALEVRADNSTVYVPTQTACGMGDTCAQACGASYDMCVSNDESIHCFDKVKQKCCPGGKGVSCDEGFYCADNAKGEQICCPEGKSLDQCAGAVASLVPVPLSTATPSSTAVTQNVTIATTGAIVKSTGASSGIAKPTLGVTSTKSGSSSAPTGEPATVPPAGAGSAVTPAGMVVLAVAGLVALL